MIRNTCGSIHDNNGDGIWLSSEICYSKELFISKNVALRECLTDNYFAFQTEIDDSLPFINEMMDNHRKCRYWTLLRQFTPSILDLKTENGSHRKGQQKKRIIPRELLENNSQTENVYLYLRSIFLKVVPKRALGSTYNRNCFLKKIKKLLSVGLHGCMSLHHLIDGIKTKHVLWLHEYNQSEKRQHLSKYVHFLMMNFISPLVQSFFVVTESTSFKNRLFFYRKNTWQRLTQLASCRLFRTWKLKKVSQKWVDTKQQQGRCLGVATVRFLVKSQALRPIVNLSAGKKNKASVNQHLKILLLTLTYEKDRNPEAFGATLMRVDDIHLRWKSFVSDLRKENKQKLYFVKIDIEKCFETINPCLLYGIVKRLLGKSFYKIYKYRKCIRKDGEIKYIYFENLEHPSRVCTEREPKTECCGSYELSKEVLIDKLCALLFCNVLKMGKQCFVPTVGISQGSSLSNILCGAYYSFMEKTMLYGIIGKHDLLARMIDDILFVTPSKSNAEKFLQIMLDGIPQFNCRSNLNKCVVSFEYTHPVFGTVPCLTHQNSMKFCGLSFDTETLNVYPDFSNYENVETKDTISWDLTTHPGNKMKQSMLMSVRPKCSSILFDNTINTLETIEYNILCIFAVCAVKFHCFVMQLPPKRRILNNPSFFMQIIQHLPNELIKFVIKSFKKISLDGSKIMFPLSSNAVSTLCYHTFLFKLSKHYSIYVPLIEILKRNVKLSQHYFDVSKILPQVFHIIHLK